LPDACRQPNESGKAQGYVATSRPDRARIVPETRPAGATDRSKASVTDRHQALSWTQRLKRVFAIEIETCCSPQQTRPVVTLQARRFIACQRWPVSCSPMIAERAARAAQR